MWWWISKRNFPAKNCLNLVFGWWNLMSFPLVELRHVHRWWRLSRDILNFAAPAFFRKVNLILTFDYVASLPNGLVQPRMLKAFGWVLILFFWRNIGNIFMETDHAEKRKTDEPLYLEGQSRNWSSQWQRKLSPNMRIVACSIYSMMVLLIFAANYLYNTDGCVAKQGRIQMPKSNTLLIRDHSIIVRIQAMKIWK